MRERINKYNKNGGNDGMKNLGEAYYNRIKGMFVPFGHSPEAIERDINNYIDKIEFYTEQIENSFESGATTELIKNLEEVQKMLQKVYAIPCESNVIILLRSARLHDSQHSRKLLQQTIADLLLLSIEMQKAQHLGVSDSHKYKKVEVNEQIAVNMSAVGRLIETGDYDKARSIVSDARSTTDAFGKMDKMLVGREYNRAGELAKTLEKEHVGHITQSIGKDKGTKIVLAVDDRPEILTTVTAALRGHYRVLAAPDGQVALQIMGQHKVDLFFLDIDMPGMDGFELARRIRADRKYADTPILFLTAHSSRDHIARAINLGSNDFIVKPATNITLLAKARRYMDMD